MKKLNIGVIGIGNMGKKHCLTLSSMPNAHLAAVATRSAKNQSWAKEKLAVPVFASGKELIQSSLCDAVVIATPHYQHEPISLLAFQQGLHVLSEKPAGVSSLQVRRMIAASERQQCRFSVMLNQRMRPLYQKLAALVHSGELGELVRVNWTATNWFRTQAYYDSVSWRGTWGTDGGGVLLNQCPHQLDLLQYLCGMPQTVQAFCQLGHWHKLAVEDEVTVFLTFPNGATGTFIATTGEYPGVDRLEISFEKGRIVAENDELTVIRLPETLTDLRKTSQEFAPKPSYTVTKTAFGRGQEYAAVFNQFCEGILQERPFLIPGVDGLNSVLLANACYLSFWTGQKITLPFDEKRYADELAQRS